ncbi:MAG: hypothetical protein LBS64_00840 [Spirochaetaceae bacterium]|jgi:hypothetical protein|nr:hypothetical protein [Spirochaetaceae bacterium]
MDSTIIAAVISAMTNCFGQDTEHFSPTRDVFTARVQTYITETQRYLEAAIMSEIGNNTFDHNGGLPGYYTLQWRFAPCR